MADTQRLNQVLNNLLFSVGRHAPDSSNVTVSASLSDIYVAVTVSAEMGVMAGAEPTALLQRMLGPEAKDVGKAVGGEKLALDLSRGIVEAHGGRLRDDKEVWPDRKSFTFTIPVAAEPSAETPLEKAISDDSRDSEWDGLAAGEKGRVIVASEDARMLSPVRRTLAKAGYLPISVSYLNDLERITYEENPDLVLLDKSSWPAAGLELTRRLYSDYGVPVIVLSGLGDDENIERAFAKEADDYIVKPFSPTKLVARTTASLRKRSGKHQAGSTNRYQCGDVTVDYAGQPSTNCWLNFAAAQDK